jgi:hypothetical protein
MIAIDDILSEIEQVAAMYRESGSAKLFPSAGQ